MPGIPANPIIMGFASVFLNEKRTKSAADLIELS